MPSFGEKLKHERESRNKSVEEMARATGIQLSYLQALEQDEFQALPGRAFGKLYIRAYAETLGFDPQPLIDDYDREHPKRPASGEPKQPEPGQPRRAEAVIARWRETKLNERSKPGRGAPSVEADPEPPAEIRAEAADAPEGEAAIVLPTEGSRSSLPGVLALVCFGLFVFLGTAVAYFAFFAKRIDERALPATARKQAAARKDPSPIVSPPEPHPLEAQEEPGPLSVSESGVGRRIVEHRLEGQGDRFEEGDVAWFSTRILGGKPGDFVRHVWLHEGRAVQSIQLGVGGPNWRTHSNRRLRNPGQWVVEARDEGGRVLARVDFTCASRAP